VIFTIVGQLQALFCWKQVSARLLLRGVFRVWQSNSYSLSLKHGYAGVFECR
jgi:hypothetical protein